MRSLLSVVSSRKEAKRVNSNGGEGVRDEVEVIDEELIHILPSYQLDESVFGRRLGSSSVIQEEIPDYSEALNLHPVLDDLDLHEHAPTQPAESILFNLPSVLYSSESAIELELKINDPESCLYTTGDLVAGSLIIRNNTERYQSFDMLTVTLEGRINLLKDMRTRSYSTDNFICLVDLTSTITETDISSTGSQIQLDKSLPPHSSYERSFQFKFPDSLPLQAMSRNSLSGSNELPSSIGILHFVYPANPFAGKNRHTLENHQLQNDLTDLTHSISYSVNARLLKIDLDGDLKICKHSESVIRFISSNPRDTNYLTPTQQLKLFIKLAKREFLLARDHPDEFYDKREKFQHSARPLLEQRAPSIISKISIDSLCSFASTLNFKQNASWNVFKKTGTLRTEGSLKLVCPERPACFEISWGQNESNQVDLNFVLLYTPPEITDESSLKRYDPNTLFPSSSDCNLSFRIGVLKIEFKSQALPIDVDPAWFTSNNAMIDSLITPLSEILKVKNSLPPETRVPKSTLEDVKSLLSKKQIARHRLEGLFQVSTSDSSWRIDDTRSELSYVKDISVALKLKPSFLQKYRLVPSFQCRQLARTYFLDAQYFLPTPFSKLFSTPLDQTTVNLDIPIEISYLKQ